MNSVCYVANLAICVFIRQLATISVGLTMWQMWQMPRASGLRGASGSKEKNFQPVISQVI